MARKADSPVTLVVDPEDDVAVLARLRRLHARPAGQVLCEPPPGAGSTVLAHSLLAALAKNHSVATLAVPLWELVSFHLRSEHTRELILCRAHTLTYTALRALCTSAAAADVHVWLVVPRQRPPAQVAKLLEALPYDTTNVNELIADHAQQFDATVIEAAVTPPTHDPAPEHLNTRDVLALLAACSARAPTGIRNRALLAVLYRSGLRLSEALALAPGDIDADQCALDIRAAHTAHQRRVGLDEDAFAYLQRWLQVRRDLGLQSCSRVFCTLNGTPINDSYVRHLLQRLRRKAAIPRRVHAYALRRAHALELASEQQPLGVIAGQLGPSKLAHIPTSLAPTPEASRIAHIRARTGWTNP